MKLFISRFCQLLNLITVGETKSSALCSISRRLSEWEKIEIVHFCIETFKKLSKT
jgi:hypothetical protein